MFFNCFVYMLLKLDVDLFFYLIFSFSFFNFQRKLTENFRVKRNNTEKCFKQYSVRNKTTSDTSVEWSESICILKKYINFFFSIFSVAFKGFLFWRHKLLEYQLRFINLEYWNFLAINYYLLFTKEERERELSFI